MNVSSFLAGALLAAALAVPAQAQTVVNGGFETGDFSGWTVSGGAFTGVGALAAQSGAFGAYFGEASPGSSLSQTLGTVAGTVYTVSFWLQLDDGALPNSFSFGWNGVTQPLGFNDTAAFAYTHFTATVTAAGPSSTLSFSFVNPESFWLLDNVAVTPVPEPQAWLLGSLGLVLLAARRVGRRRG